MKDINFLFDLISKIKPVDSLAIKEAQAELDRKMKPKDSLGVLEDICKKVASIYGFPIKKLDRKCHILVAADNGVIEEGVSSCPIEYTPIVSEAMLNHIACIGIFTKTLGVDLNVVDIGMKNDIKREYPNLIHRKVKRGTNNFYKEKAMSMEECLQAIFTGIDLINERANDYDIFSNGEMGIGNTTTSSALLYSVTRGNIDVVVGRGGGLSDEGLNKKKKIIVEACERYGTFDMNAVEMMAAVGGFDLACMLGMYIGAALNKKLMLVDGFISSVAALLACNLNKNIQDYLLFTHKSEEPGINIILEYLKEKTFFNMNMRLGEGTGAVLAYPIIACAIEMINTMKSPEEVYKLFFK